MTEEKRRKKRQKATGPVHFSRENPRPSETLSEVGIVLNVSDEGLCFITTCPLEEGQALFIECPWLMNGTETGTVRWCRKAAVDLWRIGLQKKTDGDNPAGMK